MYHKSSDKAAQNEKKVDSLEKKVHNLATLLEKTAEKVNSFVQSSGTAARVPPDLSVSMALLNFLYD